MNVWMRDHRVAKAEVDAFEAERAERQGDLANARQRHHEAAEGFAAVALSVPVEFPNTRGDLAIAAVASFARAGDFGRAVEFARRVLAEDSALTDYGRGELHRLLHDYSILMPQSNPVSPSGSTQGSIRSSNEVQRRTAERRRLALSHSPLFKDAA